MQQLRVIVSILAVIAMLVAGVAYIAPSSQDQPGPGLAGDAPAPERHAGPAPAADAARSTITVIEPATPPARIVSTGRPLMQSDLESRTAVPHDTSMPAHTSPIRTGSIADAVSEADIEPGDGVRQDRAQTATGEPGARSGQRASSRATQDRRWMTNFFDRQ